MTERDRIVVVVVACLAAVAAFWFMALAPKRKEANRMADQVAAAHQRLDQAHSNVNAYRAARSTYRRDYTAVARLGKAVPTDDDVPSLVYQLESAAKRSDVDFRAVKLAANAGGTTATPAPSTGTGAPATQASTATLPPGATVGSAGFPTMPFTFTFEGNFFHLSAFFDRLQRFIVSTKKQLRVSGRLLTVDGIGLQAAPEGFPRMTASVQATAYLLPADEGLTDGATAQTPAPATGGAQATPPAGATASAAPANPGGAG